MGWIIFWVFCTFMNGVAIFTNDPITGWTVFNGVGFGIGIVKLPIVIEEYIEYNKQLQEENDNLED